MPVCSPGTEQACPLGLAASHHATIGGVRGENRRIGLGRSESTEHPVEHPRCVIPVVVKSLSTSTTAPAFPSSL